MHDAEQPGTLPRLAPELELYATVPVDPRGRGELLRVAAALGGALGGALGRALTETARAHDTPPAHIAVVITHVPDSGVLATVAGRLVAMGTQRFLAQLGVVPRRAELQAAARLEAAGDQVLYVMTLSQPHCLGILGFHERDGAG